MKLSLVLAVLCAALASLSAPFSASADEADGCLSFPRTGVHNACNVAVSVSLRTKGDTDWKLISTIKAATTFSDNTDKPIEFHACFNPNPSTKEMRGWDRRYDKCCDFNKCDEEARHAPRKSPVRTVASLPARPRGASLDVGSCSGLAQVADQDACTDACTPGNEYYNVRNCMSYHVAAPSASRKRQVSAPSCPGGQTLFVCDSGTPDESKRCLSNPNPVGCHRM